MSQSPAIPAPQMWISEPWLVPRKNNTCYLAVMRLKPLPTVSTEELGGHGGGCEKHMILAPDSWDAYKRHDFSEPRLLHLPILMFRLPAFCCKFLCNIIPFPTSSEKFTQGYLRCCLTAWSPKNSHQIKHNFQLLGCDDFLS